MAHDGSDPGSVGEGAQTRGRQEHQAGQVPRVKGLLAREGDDRGEDREDEARVAQGAERHERAFRPATVGGDGRMNEGGEEGEEGDEGVAGYDEDPAGVSGRRGDEGGGNTPMNENGEGQSAGGVRGHEFWFREWPLHVDRLQGGAGDLWLIVFCWSAVTLGVTILVKAGAIGPVAGLVITVVATVVAIVAALFVLGGLMTATKALTG